MYLNFPKLPKFSQFISIYLILLPATGWASPCTARAGRASWDQLGPVGTGWDQLEPVEKVEIRRLSKISVTSTTQGCDIFNYGKCTISRFKLSLLFETFPEKYKKSL